MLRPAIAAFGDPDLSQVTVLARQFVVSKEAAARAYAQYHDEPVAIAVVKDGKLQRTYHSTNFPSLCVQKGDPVPRSSVFCRTQARLGNTSDLVEARAQYWLQSDWGTRLPELYEQVFNEMGLR